MGSGEKDEKMEDSGRKGEDTAGPGDEGRDKEKETSQFSEGDKVLAYHGPLIYEAKILRAEFRKEWKYFVHYLGWSKNWDEWVGTDRLMALTDTNLEIQKKLFKTQNVDKQSKGRLPQGRQKALPDSKGEKEGPKLIISVPKERKKRKAESTVSEEKDTDEPEPAVKIPLPPVLKKQLVDDWDLIQAGKLIKLPRSPNVVEILKKYREFKIKRDSICGHLVEEILNGIGYYFNKAMPAMLLYKQERAQFADAVPDGAEPSLIYGAEHLLRLFVKLPELLGYANMEEHALRQLQQKLMDILKFLQKYQSSFFLSMYESPKVGARSQPEEKKLKREISDGNFKIFEDKEDRQDVNHIEDKRERRVGSKAVDDRREKRDVSKSSDDRSERKDSSRVMITERRDRRDWSRAADEKREDLPRMVDKEKRGGSKSSEEKKAKTDAPLAQPH